jgi:hypothetical protein
LNRLDNAGDRAAVTQCAQVMFKLYGNVFRELDDTVEASRPLRRTA